MPLIRRISRAHTIGKFRSAARQRFEEAKRSATAGDRLAGIYLCGYAAEMLLKAAYFRLRGRMPGDSITIRDLNEAKGYATTKLGLGWGGNLHDLTGWANLLVEERTIRGTPYRPGFRRSLVQQVNALHSNWREDLRYHSNRPRPAEVAVTFQAVAWIKSNYPSL